jgi:hypothetical protein
VLNFPVAVGSIATLLGAARALAAPAKNATHATAITAADTLPL